MRLPFPPRNRLSPNLKVVAFGIEPFTARIKESRNVHRGEFTHESLESREVEGAKGVGNVD